MKRIAFVYLGQEKGEYLLSDEINYNIQRRPQLGFLYMAATLKDKAKISIFDQSVEGFIFEELLDRLKNFDIVGFYVADILSEKIKRYTKKIKENLNILIVVGGPGTFQNPSYLENGCDIVCYGEGELTIQEILEYSEGKRNLEEVKGIYYKKNEVVKNPPQDLILELDSLPMPDRSKIKMNDYHDYFIFTMRKPYTTMITSRGCPYRCTYCVSHKIWGSKLRIRSVDNVLTEVDEVVKKYGVKYIAFQDDVFGLNEEWLKEFCNKLIERDYDLHWMCILHPFSLKSNRKEGFAMLKKAGCDVLTFGLQSAHPEILSNIRRDKNEAKELQETIKFTNKLGLITAVTFIFGLPGDTKETIKYTMNYATKLQPTLVNFYNLSKLRGSEIEENYKEKQVCNLSYEEINNYCKLASKRFYSQPKVLLRLSKFVIKNPKWVLKMGPQLFSVSRYLGFLEK
ncbi:MAG TPA: radical SAM protein [Candidatus Nanoarchaeia archaeon]|nr:radical SAM protein [Candidatus Nanoarchaeia archaeon]